MNVSYRWLRDMVPGLDLDPEGVAEHLALRGAPVEGMASPGDALADVVMGRVITAGRHPNADRLSLCTVDGGDGIVSVVCGAPNVREGAWYPFAPVGATLPGDFRIKKSKIRGEVSEGMLCSAKELGLGADHEGILEVHGDFTPGQSFVEAMGLGDVTMDVEVTSNRGDLLSHAGLARELASEGDGRASLPEIPGDPGQVLEYRQAADAVQEEGVSIRIDDPDLCFRYLGAVIRGVKVGPSPAWLQERLRGAGSRPINNVVDATNYVLLELGQPLHAFDLGRLGGSAIVVRRAGPSEGTFTTLDGEERKLAADMLMICDAAQPVAVAGVMGGQDSEVDDDTVDVLLECALFEPRSIRATRRALGMSTDASYRFERGVDPEGMQAALERAVAIIVATAGGTVAGPVLDVCPRPFEARVVPLRLSRIAHLLGVAFESARVRELLEPLGFDVVDETDGTLHVCVPGYRSYDVTREVDLIEEVARTHGYDAFPDTLGSYRPTRVPDHPMFQLEDDLRRELVGRGLFEAQTPAFVPEGEGDVRVSNPLTSTEPYMRRRLLPTLLRRVEYNLARGIRDVRLFEIGTSFRKAGPGEPPVEETHLALVLTGRREPPHWSVADEPVSVWDLKSIVSAVAGRAFDQGASVVPSAAESEYLDPTTTLSVVWEEQEVGRAGRVLPDRVDTPPWAGDVWALEVTLPAQAPRPSVAIHQPLPQHPGAERDLAVIVPDRVAVAQVVDTIRAGAGALLEEVAVFDVYRGEGVPEGTRSVAFGLRFRAPERTLKDKEVDRAVRAILGRLEEDLGVQPRG